MASWFPRFVGLVTVLTLYRFAVCGSSLSMLFLGVCLLGQLCALHGMTAAKASFVFAGHVTFTLAMWVGSAILHGAELWLVTALAAFTVLSRRVLGHCLFAHARGSVDTDERIYDLVYLLPLMNGLHRLRAARA